MRCSRISSSMARSRANSLEAAIPNRNGFAAATATHVVHARGRKGERAIFALRGPSCGHCDTAIPLQRRNQMIGTGLIEVCEACGVLLYAEGA